MDGSTVQLLANLPAFMYATTMHAVLQLCTLKSTDPLKTCQDRCPQVHLMFVCKLTSGLLKRLD